MNKNLKAIKNIQLLNKAIGGTEGFVSIDNDNVNNDSFRTSRKQNNEGVIEVVSVNSILSSNSDLVPFMIKIDIEGFEDDLFSANTEWVKKFPIIIVELHDWLIPKQSNSSNFLKVISQENRDFIIFGENIISFSNDLNKK